jgi:hypothetical protein
MEQLDQLQREYAETVKNLAFPLSFLDYEHLRERREAILREATALARGLNMPGPHWFNTEPV